MLVLHHIIYMCVFLYKFRRLFGRGLHEFLPKFGFHRMFTPFYTRGLVPRYHIKSRSI